MAFPPAPAKSKKPGLMIAIGVGKPKGSAPAEPRRTPGRVPSLPGMRAAEEPPPADEPEEEGGDAAESTEVGHIDPVAVHLHGPEENCGGCEFFAAPDACHEVAGPVNETMWCCLYSPSAAERPAEEGEGEGETSSNPYGPAEEGEY